MTAQELPSTVEAYLDRQFDPDRTAQFEAALAGDPALRGRVEARRAFHAFLRRRLSDVAAPAGLTERVRERLDAAERAVPAPAAPAVADRPATRWLSRSRGLTLAACVLLAACGAVLYSALHPRHLCRYLDACTAEHGRVVRGEAGMALASADFARLTSYAGTQLQRDLRPVPALAAFALTPTGAGRAQFLKLADAGAPQGVFIKYEDSQRQPLSLLLQDWPSETPTAPVVEYQGRRFWYDEQDGFGVACWKTPDGKVLCTVVGRKPKPELLDIASSARQALDE